MARDANSTEILLAIFAALLPQHSPVVLGLPQLPNPLREAPTSFPRPRPSGRGDIADAQVRGEQYEVKSRLRRSS
jgi:hypothetical protein